MVHTHGACGRTCGSAARRRLLLLLLLRTRCRALSLPPRLRLLPSRCCCGHVAGGARRGVREPQVGKCVELRDQCAVLTVE